MHKLEAAVDAHINLLLPANLNKVQMNEIDRSTLSGDSFH